MFKYMQIKGNTLTLHVKVGTGSRVGVADKGVRLFDLTYSMHGSHYSMVFENYM